MHILHERTHAVRRSTEYLARLCVPEVPEVVDIDVRHADNGREGLVPITRQLWHLLNNVVRTQVPAERGKRRQDAHVRSVCVCFWPWVSRWTVCTRRNQTDNILHSRGKSAWYRQSVDVPLRERVGRGAPTEHTLVRACARQPGLCLRQTRMGGYGVRGRVDVRKEKCGEWTQVVPLIR